MTTVKEMYGTKLTAAFSHKRKDLYRHLYHLSSYTAMPQVLIYTSAPIYHPKKKRGSIYEFFNSTFIISDFVLPSSHQMPTPFKQMSQITLSENDVFEALIGLNPNKLKVMIA